jgi:putative endonuclease
MAQHNIIGIEGEKHAAKFLINNGYTVIKTNWRYRKKEIDIIAKKNDVIIIVEVKTRSSEYFENPKEAVTIKKQKFIIEAANAFAQEYNINLEFRFDILSLLIKNKDYEIEHITIVIV